MASARAAAKHRAVARNTRVVREAGKPGVVLGPDEVVRPRWRTDLVDPVLSFVVYGVPAPQGSKTGLIRGGKVVMQESSAGVDPWRKAVRQVAVLAVQDWARRQGKAWVALDEPVLVRPSITMPATAAATRAGAVYCTSTPDLDKLQRAIGDALAPVPLKPKEGTEFGASKAPQIREQMMAQRRTVAVLHDDSRIVAWDHVQKVYPATTPDSLGFPGVTIEVFRMADLDTAAARPLVSHGEGQGMVATDFVEWTRHGSGSVWSEVASRLWRDDPQLVWEATGPAVVRGRTIDDGAARVALRVLALAGPKGVVPVVFPVAPVSSVPPRPGVPT